MLYRACVAVTLLGVCAGWGCRGLYVPMERGLAYYVSAAGDDANSGGRAQPLATLEQARDRIRLMRQGRVLPPGGVTVYLREGTYPMRRGFVLGPLDAGTLASPIVYRAYRDETVRLVGVSGEDVAPLAASPASGIEDGLVILENTAHVTLSHLRLENPSGSGVVVRDGSDNMVAACTIRDSGQYAVSISGRRNGVVGCDITDVGGGILLGGGDPATRPGDGNYATNNQVTAVERRNRGAAAVGIHLQGVGNLVANNAIHSCPEAGILFSGDAHLVEFNEIFLACRETPLTGAVQSETGRSSTASVIRSNFIHHLEGVPGIGIAAPARNVRIAGNVFFRTGPGAVTVSGGQVQGLEQNLFVDCESALCLDSGAAALHHGPIANNIIVGGSWLCGPTGVADRLTMHDNHVSDRDPGFVNPYELDFRLMPTSLIWEDLPGFRQPLLRRVGLYESPLRASWPVSLPDCDGGLALPRGKAGVPPGPIAGDERP